MSRSISHIAVVESDGGGACPEQHWGTLITGDRFYFRYRHGCAWLQLNEAIDDIDLWSSPEHCYSMQVTDEDDGIFASERQRLDTFETLLAHIKPGWLIRGAKV